MSGVNVFLTGGAGSGKSFVLRAFIEKSKAEGKNVLTMAHMLSAALLLNESGVTILNGFNTYMSGLRFDDAGIRRLYKSKAVNADIIVIDEISMCSKGLFEYVCKAIRRIEVKQHKHIQIVVCGDFYQLPPVANTVEYCFESKWWAANSFQFIELVCQHRQGDSEFIKYLNNIRKGEYIDESLAYIEANSHYLQKNNNYATLCSYKKGEDGVYKINDEYIDALPGRAQSFGALTEHPGKLRNFSNALETLTIKKDTLVMTTYNDPRGRYYNGRVGRVRDMSENAIDIAFSDKGEEEIVAVERHLWEFDDRRFVVNQFPIIPAYAMTIHKSQGRTFSHLNINPNCFAEGQLYVALSRVKDVSDLYIINEIKREYLMVNSKVRQFYNNNGIILPK